MTIQFTLSMPNVGSWNGQWSGSKNLYAVTRIIGNRTRAESILAKKSYYYNFGDGWGASISVQQIDSGTARKVRKASKGFCSYEWMIDSIVADGDIYGPTRPKPEVVNAVATVSPNASPETVKVLIEATKLVLEAEKDCPF